MAAIEDSDGRALYRVIDERARHALGGIVVARHKARDLIEADYPPAERAAALAALGDAVNAETAADLFASRCLAPCMQAIGQSLGAPTRETPAGEGVIVHTTRGAELPMYVGGDTWYGLIWNTDALMAERDRASRELKQIEDNAALYRKQRALKDASNTRQAPSP